MSGPTDSTCGLPGAGKTTLQRQLLGRARCASRGDEWLWALGPLRGTSDPEKVEHELWRLAQEILRLGRASSSILGSERIERDGAMRGVALVSA